jgi:hypothetical protein
MHLVPFEPRETVRLGLIGLGGRGRSLLNEFLSCPGAHIVALADAYAPSLHAAQQQIARAGAPPAQAFSGPDAHRHLLDCDLDLVIVATQWATHTPYAVAAMEAGKHVAVEVPAAVTLEECWHLVEASERTRRHCVMLENCCYDYWEMLVKRMAHAGLFGAITHAECAYIHELRALLLADESEGLWRREPHITRNGNLYPTHGLGPVAQCLKIGDDDAFDYLVSMNSIEASLSAYRDATAAPDSPKRNEVYACGDVNVSLLRTKRGRTIILKHDVVTPQPYDRVFLIGGTKGVFRDYPPRLFLDGVSAHEQWSSLEPYRAEWEDPLWTALGEVARGRGHGGCDYIVAWRLIQTLRDGLPPDSDVYDAAEWSAPGPLSEQSAARRSAAVDFPDFRRTTR